MDIKFIRQNPEVVKDACKKKNIKCDIDKLLDVDEKRIKVKQELEAIAAEKNKASKAIPQAKDAGRARWDHQSDEGAGRKCGQSGKKIKGAGS